MPSVKAENTELPPEEPDNEESEKEEEKDDLSLPQSFPLASTTRTQLRSLSINHYEPKREQLMKQYTDAILEVATGYIGNLLEQYVEKMAAKHMSLHDFKEKRSKIFKEDEQISRLRSKMASLRDTLNEHTNSIDSFRNARRAALEANNEPVKLSTLAEYKKGARDHRSLGELYKIAKRQSQSIQSNNPGDEMYKNFEESIFVTINPTEPIPDYIENGISGEDDVEVEGGRIDLMCPISHNLMQDPVRNKVCGHTYDKSSVINYLRNSHECPICPKKFNRNDLVEDKFMKLRLRGYNRDVRMFESRNIDLEETEDKL